MTGLSADNKLRDVFNPRVITALADDIKRVWPKFEKTRFLGAILPNLDGLGFIERSNLLRDTLYEFLPREFPKAVKILIDSLGPELNESGTDAWESFPVMSEAAFVSKYGKEHFDISMQALYEMTKRFTAEGDLRTFIEVDYERAMKILHKWCADPSPHVRRLVSEGTRPRLPLAGRIKRFQKDPRPVIELLDKLKDDESQYVRRSVANNINDIAKDNPDIVIATLKLWSKDSKPETQWIVRHAARSLIKQGHPEAMAIFGFSADPKVNVSKLTIAPKKQKRGGVIEFSFTVRSLADKAQKLVIDFAMNYVKANGKHAPKIFKLRNIDLTPNQEMRISRKVTLENTSGRTIYPGRHEIELKINGKSYSRNWFVVE